MKNTDETGQNRLITDQEGHTVSSDPYGNSAEEVVPISQFKGIIHSLRITEAYMPDRVMRQFGYP